MHVAVGTFNLNNLFSRFNFRAEISAVHPVDDEERLTSSYVFDDPKRVRIRTYKGKLVKGIDPEEQKVLARRNAPTLAKLAERTDELSLTEALAHPEETREPKPDNPPPPASGAWTHRFKESGQPAKYELFDQIWLSKSLTTRHESSHIDRRTNHGGDGSDHDPAWVVLDL